MPSLTCSKVSGPVAYFLRLYCLRKYLKCLIKPNFCETAGFGGGPSEVPGVSCSWEFSTSGTVTPVQECSGGARSFSKAAGNLLLSSCVCGAPALSGVGFPGLRKGAECWGLASCADHDILFQSVMLSLAAAEWRPPLKPEACAEQARFLSSEGPALSLLAHVGC